VADMIWYPGGFWEAWEGFGKSVYRFMKALSWVALMKLVLGRGNGW
jgi:hypothetical protein